MDGGSGKHVSGVYILCSYRWAWPDAGRCWHIGQRKENQTRPQSQYHGLCQQHYKHPLVTVLRLLKPVALQDFLDLVLHDEQPHFPQHHVLPRIHLPRPLHRCSRPSSPLWSIYRNPQEPLPNKNQHLKKNKCDSATFEQFKMHFTDTRKSLLYRKMSYWIWCSGGM